MIEESDTGNQSSRLKSLRLDQNPRQAPVSLELPWCGLGRNVHTAWLKNLLCWSLDYLSISLSQPSKPADNNRWLCFSWILSENNSSQPWNLCPLRPLPSPCLEEAGRDLGRAAVWSERICLKRRTPLPLNWRLTAATCRINTRQMTGFQERGASVKYLSSGSFLPSETWLTLENIGHAESKIIGPMRGPYQV